MSSKMPTDKKEDGNKFDSDPEILAVCNHGFGSNPILQLPWHPGKVQGPKN
jgi:hypothetical protein